MEPRMFDPSDYVITFDPREEAAQFCLPINPQWHLVFTDPSWVWLSWIKRQSGNQRLMCYKHLGTGRFIVGAWAYAPGEGSNPIVQELEGFYDSPTKHWPQDLLAPWNWKARLRPATDQLVEMNRVVRDKKQLEQSNKLMDREARNTAVRRMKKLGMDQSAHDLDRGAVPFAGPSRSLDGNQGWIDALKRMAK